jgi:hypothetical protein
MAFSGGLWRPRRRSSYDPFTDLLFNALLGFIFLLLIAIVFMNPAAKSGNIDLKAEYLITVTWPDNVPDDIDTWVEDPNGGLVWFRQQASGLMHLDRDDRGTVNDMLTINGREVPNPLNQEIVTIRGVLPGEYVVNVHYYASGSQKPVPVSVKVAKVNPALEVVYYGNVELQRKGQEHTACRFTVTADGQVTAVNEVPKQLVRL